MNERTVFVKALLIMAMPILFVVFIHLIALMAGASSVNLAFGGSGIPPVSNPDESSLPAEFNGTWLTWVFLPLFIGMCTMFYRMARHLRDDSSDEVHEEWSTWAADRGFVLESIGSLPQRRMFTKGRKRSTTGPYRGLITGNCDALVGTTSWVESSEDGESTRQVHFVIVRMPDHCATRFPSCTVSRHVNGSCYDYRAGQKQIRFESTQLDESFRILVGGDPSGVQWRELFDPILLEGISQYGVEWSQDGTDLMFMFSGQNCTTVPVARLDTLCIAAAFVLQRYMIAAQGDVSGAAIAA